MDGIRTEKRPGSEVNLTHPPSSMMGSAVTRGVLLGAGVVGRFVCSCAAMVKLRASVMNTLGKNRFMLKFPPSGLEV
jgi:hypothetical protein